jgi:hypothetical protein
LLAFTLFFNTGLEFHKGCLPSKFHSKRVLKVFLVACEFMMNTFDLFIDALAMEIFVHMPSHYICVARMESFVFVMFID